jgi:hypothetical protein
VIGYLAGVILLAGGLVTATLAHAWLELASDEIRGWLEVIPGAILRAAAMRLPADQRLEVYRAEWLPDLLYITRRAEGRPITRFLVGTRFSLGHLRSARRQARDLRRAQRRELAAAESSPYADRVEYLVETRTASGEVITFRMEREHESLFIFHKLKKSASLPDSSGPN